MKVRNLNKLASTKQKLLHIVKKEHRPTIGELMAYFTISEVAVRKHIHELEINGYLKKNRVKQRIGRPYFTYELTKKGHDYFPNHYEHLPLELLQELEEWQGEDAVSALLQKRAERETTSFKKEITTADFDHKIKEVAKIQDEKGYMVEVETTDDGHYIIKNYNCPISNIASAYQQVCTNEKKMLEDIFREGDVSLQTCISKGDNLCKWIIKRPKKDDAQ